MYLLSNSDIVNFVLKTNSETGRKPYFNILYFGCDLNFLFLVLFKNGGWWVFNLFVSGVNHGNEEAMRVQDFFALPQEWKDSS